MKSKDDKRDKTIAGIQIMATIGIPIMILGVQIATSIHKLLTVVIGGLIIVVGIYVLWWALIKFAKL
jgi:hypothetical protein